MENQELINVLAVATIIGWVLTFLIALTSPNRNSGPVPVWLTLAASLSLAILVLAS